MKLKMMILATILWIASGPALGWFIEPEDVIAYRAGEEIRISLYFDVAARRCRSERAEITLYIGNMARHIPSGRCSSAGGGRSVYLHFSYRVQPGDQGIPCIRANALPFNVLWPWPGREGQPPGVSHEGFCSEYPVNGGPSIYPPNAIRHHLPFLHSATGLLRIVNRSGDAGEVWITGADDAGNRTDRITLTIGSSSAVNLKVQDLENGYPDIGLHIGIGTGEGHWQLEIVSVLNILPLAYVRNPDSSIAPMHGTIPDGELDKYIPFFNPEINTRRQSLLRLVNPSDEGRSVSIRALNDNCIEHGAEGCNSGENLESFTIRRAVFLPPYTSIMFTAQNIVNHGYGSIDQGLPGPGKYRLFIYPTSEYYGRGHVAVMNLLRGPDGSLTDLSLQHPGGSEPSGWRRGE